MPRSGASSRSPGDVDDSPCFVAGGPDRADEAVLADGTGEVVLPAAAEAGIPAEAGLLERVGGEPGRELERDPLDDAASGIYSSSCRRIPGRLA